MSNTAKLVTLQQWAEFAKGKIAGEELRDNLVNEERDSAVLKATQVTWTETRAELLRQQLEEKEDGK